MLYRNGIHGTTLKYSPELDLKKIVREKYSLKSVDPRNVNNTPWQDSDLVAVVVVLVVVGILIIIVVNFVG